MTYLLDTSALLAHHLAEAGADRVQALFDDESNILGICVLTILEFESRLHQLGLDDSDRVAQVRRYQFLINEVVPVTEIVCATALQLKLAATARLPNVDACIATPTLYASRRR